MDIGNIKGVYGVIGPYRCPSTHTWLVHNKPLHYTHNITVSWTTKHMYLVEIQLVALGLELSIDHT